MIVHIYLITNEVTGKYYVGQTSCDVSKRFRDHISSAKSEKVTSSPRLRRSMRCHGIDKFSVQELAVAKNEKEGDYLETLWIVSLDAMNPTTGYNLTLGGRGVRGVKWSEDRRARASKAQKGISRGLGHIVTQETRDKISAATMGRISPLKGVSPSLETRQKLSENHKGKTVSEETRNKLRIVNLGKTGYWKGRSIPVEARKKMSEVRQGKPWSAVRRAAFTRRKAHVTTTY